MPCVLLVTMRGEFADFNSWQVPMGSITEPVLNALRLPIYRIDEEAEVEATVDAACNMAFSGGNFQVAILLSQRMVDRNKPRAIDRGSPQARRRNCWRSAAACWSSPASARRPMTSRPAATMRAISTSGAGLAARRSVGLGLALARPDRRVAVITGDGDVLMALGSLATIGVKQPKNLSIVCLDNGHYSATGMQPSATSAGIDLAAAAAACRLRVEAGRRSVARRRAADAAAFRRRAAVHPRPRRCRRPEAHHPEPRRRRRSSSASCRRWAAGVIAKLSCGAANSLPLPACGEGDRAGNPSAIRERVSSAIPLPRSLGYRSAHAPCPQRGGEAHWSCNVLAASLRLGAGELDHLGPLLGLRWQISLP